MRPPPPPRKRASVLMMVTGIVGVGLGATVAIAGSALAASAHDSTIIFCETSVGVSQCGRKDNGARMGAGVAMIVGGGIALVAGVPLWILGARRVPLDDKEKEPSPKPTVSIGPTSASLRWSF
jgi:hypothetical protein